VRLRRYAEAEPLLLQAVAQLERTRGPRFYTTQLAYQTLRELYQDTGRVADAARMTAKITS
jgi:hypothetical protein